MTTRGLIALLLAFAAGAAVERYRQGRRERPLRLADTPSAWAHAVRHSVGEAHALAAALAVAAALALLLLPSLAGAPMPDRPRGPGLARTSATLPRVEVVRRDAGRAFTMRGLRLRVFRVREPRPGVAPLRRAARRGRAWLSVGVDVRNLRRRRFVPNALAYRLGDGRGRSYWPDIGGGTGPASLAQTGHLRRGELARTRLSFRVPRGGRRLALVFEPSSASALQVRIPLGRSGQFAP
jgi:hypothetical protein